jgi:putative transposase
MPFDPRIHHRRSVRLGSWDYAWAWWYFVTVCTEDRACCLGRVDGRGIELSPEGRIVHEQWTAIPQQFPAVDLDVFVIMPNHLHGIIILNDPPHAKDRRGLINQTPPHASWSLMRQKGISLGKVLRAFKARTTRLIRVSVNPGFGWQRNYYDHILRNDADLHRVRTYMANNPLQWDLDEENPAYRP